MLTRRDRAFLQSNEQVKNIVFSFPIKVVDAMRRSLDDTRLRRFAKTFREKVLMLFAELEALEVFPWTSFPRDRARVLSTILYLQAVVKEFENEDQFRSTLITQFASTGLNSTIPRDDRKLFSVLTLLLTCCVYPPRRHSTKFKLRSTDLIRKLATFLGRSRARAV